MNIKQELEKLNTNLVGKPYIIIKVYELNENIFNCVSFTLNIFNYWIWTNEKRWPRDIPRNLGINSFKMLYSKIGYDECDSDLYEEGYDKIAFYAKNNIPKHAAKQFGNKWRSKVGPVILEHNLDWLCGNGEYEYGDVVFIMKRKI
jgi:hypothetical protein